MSWNAKGQQFAIILNKWDWPLTLKKVKVQVFNLKQLMLVHIAKQIANKITTHKIIITILWS